MSVGVGRTRAASVLLAPLLGLLVLVAPLPVAAAVEPTDGAESLYQPPFDTEQVTSDLLAAKVVVLPGSIARFDQQKVDSLTSHGDVKVLVAPPGPLDSAENTDYRTAVGDVRTAVERQWDGRVVRVVGVEVDSVGQTDVIGARHLLQTLDVTSGLEFITPYLQGGDPHQADIDPAVVNRTDSALVSELTAQLRADPVVMLDGATAADPSAGVPNPEKILQTWRESTGTDLRLVVLPPLQDGEAAGVTAEDLAPAFPGQVVALFQGRWFEVAGPDQQVLDVASTMTLSRYLDFQEGRQVGPANTLLVLGNQYAELTSGAVEDQPSPTQRNPLAWLLLVLPWLALLVVVVFALRNRSHRKRRREAADRHGCVADLAGAAGTLPDLADGILALDGLARSGPASEHLVEATQRYRSARRLIADGKDGAAAAKAVLEGRKALTAAAHLLDVPNVPGTLPADHLVTGGAR